MAEPCIQSLNYSVSSHQFHSPSLASHIFFFSSNQLKPTISRPSSGQNKAARPTIIAPTSTSENITIIEILNGTKLNSNQ
jgi:hypothetical protein